MSALSADARAKGFQAMKDSTTAAGRVRRTLKAGRPTRVVNQAIPVLTAIKRLVDEADHARLAMHNEGLDPDDIRLALAFATPETGDVGLRLVPQPGQFGTLISALEKMATETPVFFLGIIWEQRDREAQAKGQPGQISWVTQWMAGPLVEAQLRAVLDIAKAKAKAMAPQQ